MEVELDDLPSSQLAVPIHLIVNMFLTKEMVLQSLYGHTRSEVAKRSTTEVW